MTLHCSEYETILTVWFKYNYRREDLKWLCLYSLFDCCLVEYHVCNWVKRSIETVSVHVKPYRVLGKHRVRLTTANDECSVSLFRKNTTRRKRQRTNV